LYLEMIVPARQRHGDRWRKRWQGTRCDNEGAMK